METEDKELHDMTAVIMFGVSKHLFWKQIGVFDRIFVYIKLDPTVRAEKLPSNSLFYVKKSRWILMSIVCF